MNIEFLLRKNHFFEGFTRNFKKNWQQFSSKISTENESIALYIYKKKSHFQMKITIYGKNPQVGHTSFVKVGNKRNDRKSNCQTVHVPLENPAFGDVLILRCPVWPAHS